MAMIQMSKSQLDVINKELDRMHNLVITATDPKAIEWAKSRITEIQTQLLTCAEGSEGKSGKAVTAAIDADETTDN